MVEKSSALRLVTRDSSRKASRGAKCPFGGKTSAFSSGSHSHLAPEGQDYLVTGPLLRRQKLDLIENPSNNSLVILTLRKGRRFDLGQKNFRILLKKRRP
jgi:hypothetical protein